MYGGLPEFISSFKMSVTIEDICGPINAIKMLIENNGILKVIDPDKRVLKAIWPSEVDKFCLAAHSGELKFSIGFKGFYPDPREFFH